MPYIVTTKRPCPACQYGPNAGGEHRPESVSRVAVATLEEARDAVNAIVQRPAPPWSTEGLRFARECPVSGGTVGPLPDGSLIEVDDTTWMDLFNESGLEWLALGLDSRAITDDFEFSDEAKDVILAAFNEANR